MVSPLFNGLAFNPGYAFYIPGFVEIIKTWKVLSKEGNPIEKESVEQACYQCLERYQLVEMHMSYLHFLLQPDKEKEAAIHALAAQYIENEKLKEEDRQFYFYLLMEDPVQILDKEWFFKIMKGLDQLFSKLDTRISIEENKISVCLYLVSTRLLAKDDENAKKFIEYTRELVLGSQLSERKSKYFINALERWEVRYRIRREGFEIKTPIAASLEIPGLCRRGNNCWANSHFHIIMNIPSMRQIFDRYLNEQEKNHSEEVHLLRKSQEAYENHRSSGRSLASKASASLRSLLSATCSDINKSDTQEEDPLVAIRHFMECAKENPSQFPVSMHKSYLPATEPTPISSETATKYSKLQDNHQLIEEQVESTISFALQSGLCTFL